MTSGFVRINGSVNKMIYRDLQMNNKKYKNKNISVVTTFLSHVYG